MVNEIYVEDKRKEERRKGELGWLTREKRYDDIEYRGRERERMKEEGIKEREK